MLGRVRLHCQFSEDVNGHIGRNLLSLPLVVQTGPSETPRLVRSAVARAAAARVQAQRTSVRAC